MIDVKGITSTLTHTIGLMQDSRSVRLHRTALNESFYFVREELLGIAKNMPKSSVQHLETKAAADDVSRVLQNLW
ncbi:MAG: hypothetical protein H7123_02115, partial [Thermoleophilia bacterium]|nr:hypothetical protein [Thermoleophilia bacterium]